ncbi:MAG: cytochrome c biogenesis protein CcsA [Candidatus Brocadiales bacterium]
MGPQDIIDLSMVFFWMAFAVYTTYWFFGFCGKKVRFLTLLTGVTLQLAMIGLRGIAIGYFPLTNKFESFTSFALSTFIILLIYSRTESKVYRMILFGVGYAFLIFAILKFSHYHYKVSYAPPLMLTIWYPLHVPMSFFCYSLWTSSMAAGIAWFCSEENNQSFIELIDTGFLYGLLTFSISMVFGGLWGYVAWGSYFLWDAKVLWSVIIWFFYATCIHIDYWQEAKRFKPTLSILGFLIMLTTYVGTSFFSQSSHSF